LNPMKREHKRENMHMHMYRALGSFIHSHQTFFYNVCNKWGYGLSMLLLKIMIFIKVKMLYYNLHLHNLTCPRQYTEEWLNIFQHVYIHTCHANVIPK
jgi:hypothetical protein